MNERPLHRLARLVGIARTYRDIRDRAHEASDETLHRILTAMGYAADTVEAISATIEAIETVRWRRRVPPTASAKAGDTSLALRITLPTSEVEHTLQWRLLDETSEPIREGQLRAELLATGQRRRIDDEDWIEATLRFPLPPDPGYYDLELIMPAAVDAVSRCLVIVAPERCYRPAELEDDGRLWGLTAQLYGLRSQRNWGIGDFTDLMRLVEFVADRGGAFVGINPLHELGMRDGSSRSPYWPSTRRFLNPLYIDVESVPEYTECEQARGLVEAPDFQALLRTLRAADLVDYGKVADAKHAVLEALFEHFHTQHRGRGTERDRAFEIFCDGQEGLEAYLGFEVLQEQLSSSDSDVWGWPAWPAEYQRAAAARAALRRRHKRAEFFAYLQWNAFQQLDAVNRRASELGMPIGVAGDLAVGTRHGGADSWVDRDCFLDGIELGAPPDEFNQAGQSWGLQVWNPVELREAGYRPFIETLRANMRLGGALRIDHIMALMRCFIVPAGKQPIDGTYLHYRLEDMLAIVALESRRNRCLVIGEDLGTVPEAIRAGMRGVGALGYQVLYFEKDESGAVTAPEDFAHNALSVASTHDLPTLEGFWRGRDIEWRTELGVFGSDEEREQQIIARAEDRARLLVALERQGLEVHDGSHAETAGQPVMSVTLRTAIHAYLSRCASQLIGVQAEDLLGEVEQANLPGTVDGHPNWQRRLGLQLEAWPEDAGVKAIIDTVRRERGAPVGRSDTPAPFEPATMRAEIPRASYRVQLHAGFRCEHLTAIVPYLDALGVSHCYCSPYLKARPGSTHGYDVIDHSTLNPEIGSDEDFARLGDALAARGMGQILDIVPNHVAIMGRDNAWWLDVLENGPASRYADYFDIDWQPPKDSMRGKVLLPVLGDLYGNVLDRGELTLSFDTASGSFAVEYHEHLFPIDPREYPRILERDIDQLRQRLAEDDTGLVVFESLLTAFGKLPARWRTDEESKRERERDLRLHQSRLAELASESPDIEQYIGECLRSYNGDDSYPADAGRLHELLEAQAYRLAYWRLASHEINYRRFFDVNELASLRMEVPEVFDATHAFVLELFAEGRVQGLRVDHPDGLYDPKGYFHELQQRAGATEIGVVAGDELPLYVVAEKILAKGEALRRDWPIHGTTGYEFGNLLTRFFTEPAGLAALDLHYRELTADPRPYEEQLREAKRLIMQTSLASELTVLANELDRLAEQDSHTRDFGLGGLHQALLEVVAVFPVYRTYVVGTKVDAADAELINAAVDAAKQRSEAADTQVFEYLRDVLLHRSSAGQGAGLLERATAFGMRLQQFTSPVAAKGMEDTAFYRYARLISLNEVGGTPEQPTASIADLHAANVDRLQHWPHAMLGTSTHDAKRSEDVRARISVLSEVPDEWAARTQRWRALNDGLRTVTSPGRSWPDPDFEYFLYQTLVGTWPVAGLDDTTRPDYVARIEDYAVKAAREAKRHTSWIDEHPDYEAALRRFVKALLDPERSAQFIDDFESLHARILRAGLFGALGQLTLKLTSPGVPDIYQGNELWRFDLVDPDNRRPVDFERRTTLLHRIARSWSEQGGSALTKELIDTLEDGHLKMLLTWRILGLRRELPALFDAGSYEPIAVTGERAEHVLAFARRYGNNCILVAVARWHTALMDSTRRRLDPGKLDETRLDMPRKTSGFVSRLTGKRLVPGNDTIPLAAILDGLPAQVLVGSNDQ